ncbi:MAG: STAS domain-containing protein [Peptococcaceae bacterium]
MITNSRAGRPKDFYVITVQGRMDARKSLQLKEKIKDLWNEGYYNFVFDLTGVDFIDSAFLGVVVFTLRMTLNHNGAVRFTNGNPGVMQIIRKTRFDKIFEFHDTLEDALRGQ